MSTIQQTNNELPEETNPTIFVSGGRDGEVATFTITKEITNLRKMIKSQGELIKSIKKSYLSLKEFNDDSANNEIQSQLTKELITLTKLKNDLVIAERDILWSKKTDYEKATIMYLIGIVSIPNNTWLNGNDYSITISDIIVLFEYTNVHAHDQIKIKIENGQRTFFYRDIQITFDEYIKILRWLFTTDFNSVQFLYTTPMLKLKESRKRCSIPLHGYLMLPFNMSSISDNKFLRFSETPTVYDQQETDGFDHYYNISFTLDRILV